MDNKSKETLKERLEKSCKRILASQEEPGYEAWHKRQEEEIALNSAAFQERLRRMQMDTARRARLRIYRG